MNDPIARLAETLQDHQGFLTQTWERMAEADAIVAEYPAEENTLSGDECCEVARRLVGDDDLVLQFAVFCALTERMVLAEMC